MLVSSNVKLQYTCINFQIRIDHNDQVQLTRKLVHTLLWKIRGALGHETPC